MGLPSMVELAHEEPNFCHCWLHWAGGNGQISAGEGSVTPKTIQCPLPWCSPGTPCWHSPLPGQVGAPQVRHGGSEGTGGCGWGGQEAAPLLQTARYLHQIPFSEGAWGGGDIFWSYFWGPELPGPAPLGWAGFGGDPFPSPSSTRLDPPHLGGGDSSVMEWGGMQEAVGDRGARGGGGKGDPTQTAPKPWCWRERGCLCPSPGG